VYKDIFLIEENKNYFCAINISRSYCFLDSMINQIKKYWKPLFAVIVWGFSFIATKNALMEVSPVVIVFIRQILGIVFLTVVAVKNKNSFSINLKDHKWIFVLSLIASVHLWIQVTGLQWTSASNTGWIIGTTPVFIAILAFIIFKEKMTTQQIIGIVVSFFGLLTLISKGDFLSIDLIKNKGDALVVASSGTWAIYSIVNKKVILHYSPIMTTLYMFMYVSLILAPFAINEHNINAVVNLSPIGWISIMFLGIICSGAAYALWAQTLKDMSATQAGVFLYLEPFVTLLGAWVLLSEHITALTFLSGITIIGGVILVNRK
jgi:drug/metabolite transporter (DMT)-like permease